MITIPLSSVVAFLQRRGVDLACLEGAPLYYGWTGAPVVLMGYPGRRCASPSADAVLYLGFDKVCPAAMGWATEVLRAIFDAPRPCVIEDAFDDTRGSVCLWGVSGRLYARWTWTHGSAMGRAFREVRIRGDIPKTPAERLRAVLEYEMERA